MSQIINLRKIAISLAMFAVFALGSGIAKADPVQFVLTGADFSGSTDNIGGNVTVNISNIVGGVQISVTNNLLDANAFLGDLYMNTSVAPLTGAAGTCVNCTAISDAITFSFGSNAFRPDGDGFFDILVSLTGANPLAPGETIVFNITSSTAGFTSDSFLSDSAPGPGGSPGPFQIAAHIQGLNNGGSDFIADRDGGGPPQAIPEPASMLLLGTGLIGVAGAARRRFKGRS